MTLQTRDRADQVEVLVVGARTTGLMLAIRLRRQGLRVRIVDRSPGIDPHSRATLLHSRSLELLANLGIAAEIERNGQVLHGMGLYADGRLLMQTDDPPVDSPYPYGVAYSQKKIEILLEQQLAGLGVAVERNSDLLGLEQDRDGVDAVLGRHDGSRETVRCDWLVGCDGAHSTTRHLLGIGFAGTQSRHPYLVGDVIAEDFQPRDAFLLYLHSEGALYVAVLDEGRRQVFADLPEEHPADGTPSLEELQELVARRSGQAYRLSDPRWMAYFRINYRLAERYRQGRVFLAGDAAHLVSPAGGHGMNTGIQDACNLAWKLALASRGLASEALLESYEAERRPVARSMIEVSRGLTAPGEAYPRLSGTDRADLLAELQQAPEDILVFRRNFEELDLDYGDSPLSFDEDPALPADLRPGLEARDVAPLQQGGQSCSLFDLLGGPKHCLLVFAGEESLPTEARDAALMASEQAATWVDVHLVLISKPAAEATEPSSLLLDSEAQLTRRYGMQKGGLYLIRPDGYVAYRAVRLDGFATYLAEVLCL